MSKSFQIWDQFFPLHFFKDSDNIKSLDFGKWGQKTFKRSEKHRFQKILLSKAKFAKKLPFLCGNFKPFMSKSFQIWDHFLPLLFPKDS